MPLFDPDALTKHRARADAMLLHERAADDVEDRLTMVNRAFTCPAVITPFPTIWGNILSSARIVPDCDTLDLTPGAHDLIIHAMALHWANDPVGQLIQCRRALRPDGLLIATFLGGETLTELRAALTQAEAELTGGLSPRVAPMGDIRDLGGLLGRAGFALPVADSARLTLRYRDALHLMHDLRAMGETNAMTDRVRHFSRRDVLLRAAALYPTDDTGRAPATFETITLTGWAPDDSQPQPLKRGSATTRLADALAQLKPDDPT